MDRASTSGRFWWRGADGAEALPPAAHPPEPEPEPDFAPLDVFPPRPAGSRIPDHPAEHSADASLALAVPVDRRPPLPEPRPARGRPGPAPLRRTARAPRLMTTLLAASLAGAVLFTGLSGFGRQVRVANPLPQQIDAILRWAGLSVEEVWLTGHRHTLDSDVFAALDLASAPSLLTYDVGAARRRVEALSWVASAQLLRVLPDKLQVRIVERTPVAVWTQDGQRALVDATGRVLARLGTGQAPVAAADLPLIAGEGAPEAAAELLAALARHPDIARRVETSIRIGRRRWTLALADGSRIHLPASSSRAALDRLAGLLGSNLALNRPRQVIDLRQAGLVAVGPAPSEAKPTAPRPRADLRGPHRTVVE